MKFVLILQALGSDFKLFHLCYISYHQYFHFGFGNLEILEVGDRSLHDSALVYHFQFFFLSLECRSTFSRCSKVPRHTDPQSKM